MQDNIFDKPIESLFSFDDSVASVFDDMIERSVPFYKEFLRLSAYFAIKSTKEGSLVYDLGSSTGNTLFAIEKLSKHKLNLIGIDNSKAMIAQSNRKKRAYGSEAKFEEADIIDYELKPCDVIVSNFTLQFIRPIKRVEFVAKIYNSLNKNGLFILSEKVLGEDKVVAKQMIDLYHSYKKSMGYSDYEIAQKREALENVLVPFSMEENITMLKNVGFSSIEVVFRWVNFALFIAKK